MQLKLLNYYKFLSNFANDLVGAFVPLIIFIETGQLYIAFLYLLVRQFIRFLSNYFLRHQIRKRPQVFLLLRVVTLTAYSTFILLLTTNLWLSVVGICVFLALDTSFKSSANEIIYNYSSLNGNTNNLGMTRVFEQLGIIISMLIGGFLLDISRELVVVISLVLYGISIIPLLIYYFKSKKNNLFNKDAVSNALITFEKNQEHTARGKKIIFKILLSYCAVYLIFSMFDVVRTIYSFDLFLSGSPSYGKIGILGAIFNATYGIGSYFAGKFNDKYDLMWLVRLTCLIMGLAVASLVFIKEVYIVFVLFGVMGAVYPFLSLFVLQRMIVKSRILGVSNSALLARENSAVSGCIIMYGVALICSLLPSVTLVPVYLLIAGCLIFSFFHIPQSEERTRKLLVNFLQDNEISKSKNKTKTIKPKRVKAKKTNN